MPREKVYCAVQTTGATCCVHCPLCDRTACGHTAEEAFAALRESCDDADGHWYAPAPDIHDEEEVLEGDPW